MTNTENTITGQTACIAIEHETQPNKTAIPQALKDAALALRVKLWPHVLPYFSCRAENSLCHCIAFRGSLQADSEWVNGIFHNSPGFIGFITPKHQWIGDKPIDEQLFDVDFSPMCRGSIAKLRNRRNLTLEQAIDYVVKQVSKLKQD